MERVVVTGYGAISPIGMNAGENWESVLAGRSGVREITLFDAKNYPSRIAGEIASYNPKDHFSPKDIRRMDRFIQFGMLAGDEAFAHSGLDMEKTSPERVGTCVGVGIGGLTTIEKQFELVMEHDGPKRVTPFFIPMIIPNLVSGYLGIKYNFKGPNLCTVTACSSSAHALGESVRMIQRGDVDVMVSGGAEAVITRLGYAGFCAARALSTRNEDPSTASRPFDKGRDGFVMGEGSAILVLESLSHAQARGANIYAEVVGYAANCDANHITQPMPNGEGAADCMALALKDAKLDASSINYINTHGTSTPLGDIAETKAVKTIFGDAAKKVAVSSTKSMTGHLLGAAGAIESMFSVQALGAQVAPPTINLSDPDPECDLDYVPNEARQMPMDYAMSNSFGFGGTNATLIFKKF